jgi:hypothetical protein
MNALSNKKIIDVTYPKIGVCRYVDNRYIRYICYNKKLLGIENKSLKFSAKHYLDIKKIEMITKDKNNNVTKTDITNAKYNFFDNAYFVEKNTTESDNNTTQSGLLAGQSSANTSDMNISNINGITSVNEFPMKFTDFSDIIKFYQTINFFKYNFDTKPGNKYDANSTIHIIRERFDDELLEFITTREEIQFK